MRILQICHRVPFPPIDGGNIAMLNMAVALEENGNEVHMFALNTSKHYVEPDAFPFALKKRLHFNQSFIDTSIHPLDAFKNIFQRGSYNIERFIDASVAEDLITILKSRDFDIVQLETLFATGYIDIIRRHSKAKVILRAHNVEHIIWQRLARSEKNILKKVYLRFLARRLKTYELGVLKKIDGLVPITPVDEKIFSELRFSKPMLTLPLGIDLHDYPLPSKKSEVALFHLGSMDWLPNIEGVKWFLEKCWPEIHRRHPELKLYLAGRNFPEEIRSAKHPNVVCEGRIENANEYISNKQIMIVPLLSGSGMRVKIIQGLALGRTVISTTIGAEGIDVTNGTNILIADTPEQFSVQIDQCLSDHSFAENIGLSGRRLVESNYSNQAVGTKLSRFYSQLPASQTTTPSYAPSNRSNRST